jgi:hypothetical protein
MRLGEILVEHGVLNQDQLELALKSQLIFGGHLGTTLIEMGLLDEDTLGEVLASSTGVPYAAHHHLANIPKETIKAVPAKIAEEFQVVPFKLDGNSVHLAFVNPKDFRALDALKFAIGRAIVPWIAPEIRIFQALEKFYGVERRARYIKLDQKLDEPASPSTHFEDSAPDSAPIPVTDETQFLSYGQQDSEFGYGRSWQEIADELSRGDSAAPATPPSLMSLPELAERYCRSESRDDLARALLDFAVGRADRMLLMFVRANRATVWEERGFAIPYAIADTVAFEVTSEPLFHVLMGSDHFHGAFPAGEKTQSFYRTLGAAAPAELLLIPVHVNDQLVTLALIDGGPKGAIRGEVDEFLRAFRLFSTAVMMVALRRHLRDAARPLSASVLEP